MSPTGLFSLLSRLCLDCLSVFPGSCSRTALATFHEGKHNIGRMDMDASRGLMVTCGSDRIVKVSGCFTALKQPQLLLALSVCVCVCSPAVGPRDTFASSLLEC